ncbi:MAG: hypothetical protein E7L01_01960 [Paenibacillus macerans]|uniref:hypothetical protein n=1 Tax=Paenibacillus TaxID=44249 RepID=UPI00290CA7C4|nr:hypothetical protein [Paenibacillus macerans]MDU7472115.1 hypothetical protein [Paenibacillus macerans]
MTKAIITPTATSGTIDANPAQLYALGLGPKPRKEIDMPYQVRYVYVPQIDRYIARLLGTRQELSSNPRHFRRVTGVSNRAVLGSVSLAADQARALGFIIAEEELEYHYICVLDRAGYRLTVNVFTPRPVTEEELRGLAIDRAIDRLAITGIAAQPDEFESIGFREVTPR